MGRIVISLSVAAFFILSTAIEVYAFRCGDGYVTAGDSKTKVLLECGKPTSKEKVRYKKGRHYRVEEAGKNEGGKVKGAYLKEKKKAREK